MMYEDKVVPLWLIVYDQDPRKSYVLSDRAKVIASIKGQIYSVVPDEQADDISEKVDECFNDRGDESFISIVLPPNTTIFVHRIELDRHNEVHRVLAAAYDTAEDEDLMLGIDKLFCDPL